MKKSGKSGLGGYGHTIGGRIFITLFPAYAGVIPISERFVSSGSTLPRACGGDSSSSAHFTAVSGKPPTAPLPTLVVADVMCSGWNGRRRLAAAPSKADAGSPPWGAGAGLFHTRWRPHRPSALLPLGLQPCYPKVTPAFRPFSAYCPQVGYNARGYAWLCAKTLCEKPVRGHWRWCSVFMA